MIKKNIPNFLTLCNLLCGCIAIVFAFEGNLVWSAYMVGVACVFDFLDGLVARALNLYSEIGKQLDSLADMVSFGVVPGVMVFQMINTSLAFERLHQINLSEQLRFESIWSAANISFSPLSFISFLIPVFSAIRLAKFNLDTRQSDSFIGLPTPANAIFIASLPLVFQSELISESLKAIIFHPYFLIFLTFISSISLISLISLFALKFKNFSWADNKVRYIFLALALALLIIFKFTGIPLIIILYIVLSVINNLFSKNKNAIPTKYE